MEPQAKVKPTMCLKLPATTSVQELVRCGCIKGCITPPYVAARIINSPIMPSAKAFPWDVTVSNITILMRMRKTKQGSAVYYQQLCIIYIVRAEYTV